MNSHNDNYNRHDNNNNNNNNNNNINNNSNNKNNCSNDTVNNSLLNAIDAIEPLLLKRLNDVIVLPNAMREKCFYNLALKLEQILPNTYYIRTLMESEGCYANPFNMNSIGLILSISQNRKGYKDCSEIAFRILKFGISNSSVEPSQIFKILFSYPGAFSPISGYVGPICPFTIDQSTELLNLIIHDVNGCIKAFYDFNVYSPLFSLLKSRKIKENKR